MSSAPESEPITSWEDVIGGNIGVMAIVLSLHRNNFNLVFLGEQALPAFVAITGGRTGSDLHLFLKRKYQPDPDKPVDLFQISYDMVEHFYPSEHGQGRRRKRPHKQALEALGQECTRLPCISTLAARGYTAIPQASGKKPENAALYLPIRNPDGVLLVSFCWYPTSGSFSWSTRTETDRRQDVRNNEAFMAAVEAYFQQHAQS